MLSADNYLLERKYIPANGHNFNFAKSYYGPNLNWSYSVLPDGEYIFRVRAFNQHGMSAWSGELTAVIGGGTQVGKVTGLTWNPQTNTLSWDQMSGADEYEAEWEEI